MVFAHLVSVHLQIWCHSSICLIGALFNFWDLLSSMFVVTGFLFMTDTGVFLSKCLHGGCSGAVLGEMGLIQWRLVSQWYIWFFFYNRKMEKCLCVNACEEYMEIYEFSS